MRARWQHALAAFVVASFAAGTAHEALARCENYVPQPKPQNASRDIVGQELDTIVERGFITFAAYEDFPPYSYEENGKPAGVDIEIGELIADELGVEARFKLVSAAENLQADLRNWVWRGPLVSGSVVNVMLHVPYDSELTCRVEQVVFTGQYFEEAIAIAYRKDEYPDSKPVPAYFRFDTVGVENDSISDFYLSGLLGGMMSENITRYQSTPDAMAALERGEVMAVMGPRGQLDASLSDKIGVHEPPLVGMTKPKWPIGVGVHFAYRPLAYAVGDAITAGISDGRIEAIFDAHGLSYKPPTW